MARRKEGPRAWVRISHRTKDLPKDKRRWEVVYEDPQQNYKRRTKGGFRSKADAERWRDHEFLQPARAGHWVDPARGDATFASVAEAWLSTYVSRSGKARGYTQHAQIVEGKRSLVRTTFGDMRIGDITPSDVGRWLNSMQTEGKSASTMRHNFYSFRLVMRHAFQSRLIPSDPTVGYRGPEQADVSTQQQALEALPTACIPALIAAVPQPWDMYVRLAADSWMRPEEVAGLQLRDVLDDAAVLHVQRVLVKGKDRRKLVYEDRPKTARSNRYVDLSDDTAAHLLAYVAAHRQRALKWFSDHPEAAHPGEALPLFVGVGEFRRGERHRKTGTDLDWLDFTQPMKHSWFTARYWSAARDAAGLPDSVRFYDLRHHGISFHVARLGQPGALTIAEVSARAGHASTAMTLNRYTHPMPNRDDARRAAHGSMWTSTDAASVTRIPRQA